MKTYNKEWEDSYLREENHIFYPKEQCVKFLSRYVGKRQNLNHITYHHDVFQNSKALDFGCGIGIQTKLLEDFGLCSYGVDISSQALKTASQLNPHLKENFLQIDGDGSIGFKDNFFSVAIAESVLDSMHFEIAKKSLESLDRVVNGLVFISLIGAELSNQNNLEEIVSTLHESGTVQSYYNDEKINFLLENTNLRILSRYTISEYNDLNKKIHDIRTYLVLSNSDCI